MAYLASTLITRSFYLSQILSRELQTITGTEMSDGLYLLNEIFDEKASDTQLIPYYKEYDFNTVQGTDM